MVIVHLGGPRHGDVIEIDDEQAGKPLVYSGPRWLGVYRPARPAVTRQTSRGEAHVFVYAD